MKNKHTVQSCLNALKKKSDIRIHGNTIYVLKDCNNFKVFDLGNKSWGKIDFLVRQGYHLFWTNEF